MSPETSHHGRLSRADPARFDIYRRRSGKGYSYIDGTGELIRDKDLKSRFRSLAIPPAWTDVRLARKANSHIQAVGRDSEGRQQYIYHPDWEKRRSLLKERRLLRLGQALPRLRNAVRAALADPQLTPKTVTAAVVRLIDRALLRPGHEIYAKQRGTRGAASLLKSNVKTERDRVIVDVKGKGGKTIHKEICDPALARMIGLLRKLPGPRLFQIPDEDGNWRPVTAADVNRYIAERTGVEVSAKDFRTFEASAAALSKLCAEEATTEHQRKRAMIAVSDYVSGKLVNTRAVARNSYIHPKVTKAFEAGRLRSSILKGRAIAGLTRIESSLVRFLRRQQHN